MSEYKTTVGIEVHAELKTKSKMFCGCLNDPHASEENKNICPVCLAHPGSLPVVNKKAVEFVLKVGNAIGADLATFSEFDRKHYFYPDMPKAYQISQYEYPLVKGGELAGVKITRIHLEEDTARSQHDKGEGSLVDFNRAGVPLMELVTEPVIHDSKTAGDFCRELQLLLRTIGVSDANMERGEMRVEANISVSQTSVLGTKVEVKNLNSFKSMEAAIDFEVKRQTKLLENGDAVKQETLGWDDSTGKTFVQRSKETANDYRYFPDPDIPKFKLDEIKEFDSSRLHENTPVLPSEIRFIYRELGIQENKIEVIISDLSLLAYFQAIIAIESSRKILLLAANYLTSDVVGLLQTNADLVLKPVSTGEFVELITMVINNELNSRSAKDMLSEVVFETKNPRKLAVERGILQQNSADDLLPAVIAVIEANPTVVEEYKSGKETAIQFLLGQSMKKTKGAGNPKLLLQLLKENLR